MRRLLGVYLLGAPSLMYIWLLLPHAAGVNDAGVAYSAGALALLGVVSVLWPHYGLRPFDLNTVFAAATASTGLVYYFSGRPGGTFDLLFVWSAPFAFVLLSRTQAVLQMTFTITVFLITANLRPVTLRGQRLSTALVGVASIVVVSALADQLARFLLSGRDERQRLSDQLAQSQRLDSLGRLAGGIAHDFNNLLAVILNYATLVRHEVPAGSQEASDLSQIERAAERAAGLTRQLLAFARQEAITPEAVSLNRSIDGLEDILRRTLGEHIELVIRLDAGLWPVLADPGQIEQVLVNLAVNARDAMPGGGQLTIETGNVEVDEDYAVSRAALTPGNWVRLRVSDNGEGMDEETLARAFDPFFSTKEKSRGTGLGLATVHGILTQAGGYAQLYSEPGQGTTFTGMLPATGEALPGIAVESHGDQLGHETIFVVEDEEAIREVARRVLERNGYRVILASDGAEAFELLDRLGQEVDLLVTDVIMPRVSGRELADHFGSARPSAKVLYMSGYAGGTPDLSGAEVDLLEKPFSGGALLMKVREILDR